MINTNPAERPSTKSIMEALMTCKAVGVTTIDLEGKVGNFKEYTAENDASSKAPPQSSKKMSPLSSLKGTGPIGHIIKADVEEYPLVQTFSEKVTVHEMLLLPKQTIPGYDLTVDMRLDNLLVLKSKLNNLQEESGGNWICINDFVLKAAAMALRKVPECNSLWWTDDFIRQYHEVNICVAVETDLGLLVPVVQNVDKKGLAAIAEDVKTLADKAKKNSLKPADYEGGSFAVLNLGEPFGVQQFCAIVNPPQACILSVGQTSN